MAADQRNGTRRSGAERPGEGFRRTAVALLAVVLLPLLLLAGLAVFGDSAWVAAEEIADRLVAYAAFLLVMSGGVRLGQAVRINGATTGAVVALLPMAVALVALFIPERAAIGTLAVGLAATGVWDVWSSDRGVTPAWYGRLRLLMTAIAVPILIAAIVFMPGDI